MNKHLSLERSPSEIFDNLVNQVIESIDNDEFDHIIWVEKYAVMTCGCNSELEFFSEYVPRLLEKVSVKKGMDLEVVLKRMEGKKMIIGGLSYDE